MKLTDIKPNKSNPRVIKDDKFKKLVNSIREFPAMMELRPMVVDSQNVVLGGNMRLKALQELGYSDIPDTWVKRASDLTEEEKQRFIIADNVGFGEWDWDALANEWDTEKLNDWGLEIPQFTGTETIKPTEEKYTTKIDAPVYEPKNTKPEVKELYNADRYKELIQEIELSNISEDVKTMLKVASSRHIVFNYENMADFYSHSDKEVQRLMEDNALVIIDFNRAIELGYIQLNEEIRQQFESEYENE